MPLNPSEAPIIAQATFRALRTQQQKTQTGSLVIMEIASTFDLGKEWLHVNPGVPPCVISLSQELC